MDFDNLYFENTEEEEEEEGANLPGKYICLVLNKHLGLELKPFLFHILLQTYQRAKQALVQSLGWSGGADEGDQTLTGGKSPGIFSHLFSSS